MFKKLKSLFVVDDEEFKKKMSGQESVEPVSEEIPAAVSRPAARSSSPNPIPVRGEVSDKFLKILLGALEKNNLDGFDYLEFKKSLRNLEKMDMDDATRFKSAYAMAQTMNATPDHLIKTAQHYLNALSQEESKFGEALANQRSRQIQEKENQNKQLDQLIKSKEDQIKKFSAEIEAHKKQLEKQTAEIQQAAAKVQATQADFVTSYQTIVAQIQGDVEKMKQYLK